DVPVYMTGIGNVDPENSVVIRPQVNGELIRVYFKEGQHVEKGDLLAEIDARTIRAELARSEADKASNRAQLSTAQMDLDRYNNLLQQDAIAKQVVDQQRAKVQQLQAAVDVSQAAIDAANVQLAYTRIVSPISGQAGIRRVDPGNIVYASDTGGLVTITQIDPIAVLFSLPQTSLRELMPLLQHDDKPVDIMPSEGGNISVSGQLQTIDNQIDQATGTVRLKAIIPNENRHLWPGQFVVARIRTKTFEGALVVPPVAVQRGQDKNFVYRIKDGKAEIADIKVLFEDDKQSVIEGVEEGDNVVIDGQMRLKPGSAVTISDDAKKEQQAGNGP
ncbi:MAG: transporter subunit, partial [Alphaproteobacteria bacterium]|nr:transporter subunit [Alphaproteobacteria bacterium]